MGDDFVSASTHWNAGSAPCGAQLHLAVQEDVTVAACKLEHFEGEGVGHSNPIGLRIHRLVLRVGTPAVIRAHAHTPRTGRWTVNLSKVNNIVCSMLLLTR